MSVTLKNPPKRWRVVRDRNEAREVALRFPRPSDEQQTRDARTYPIDNGEPLAEHTTQYDWIDLLKDGIENRYATDPDVFVAADLLWYPEENERQSCNAPDVMVVFGRPKGPRGSYLQWREGDIPPQVVFEVLSPGNRAGEMRRKRSFYERHGVEEYYELNPFKQTLRGWLATESAGERRFVVVEEMNGFVSPRLGIRFQRDESNEWVVYGPDGEPFRNFVEQSALRRLAEHRAEEAEDKVKRLAERLRQLGIDPDSEE